MTTTEGRSDESLEPSAPDATDAERPGSSSSSASASADGASTPADPGPVATKAARSFSRRWVIGALAVGLGAGAGGGFAGGNYYARPNRRPPPPVPPAVVPMDPHSPRKGPSPAKVTIVEFVDIQCPYCDRGRQVVHALGIPEVAIVLRHRPLKFHKNARPAAIAIQAAHRQGKAWELYATLFDHRTALDDEHILGYAKDVGVDVPRFESDLKDPAVAAEVDADSALADKLIVASTPSYFINGRGVRGAKPREAFLEIINEEIAAVDALLASGVPLADVFAKRSEANVSLGPRA